MAHIGMTDWRTKSSYNLNKKN